MPRLVCLIALLLIAALPARAQSAIEEDLIIEQAELRAMQPRNEDVERGLRRQALTPAAMLGIVPEANLALVLQSGEQNNAAVEQHGVRNLVVMQQTGIGNTSALEQIGDGNSILATLDGNYNFLSISQRGNDNRYELDFQGDDLNHTVSQHGDGLTAVQTGSARRPFSIEQHGRGSGITVEHNP